MQTVTTLKRLTVLCAGTMLWACADLSGNFSLPEQAALRRADDAYALGRNYHLAHKYEDAVKAYREALRADPQHVNARNGLATIYAERRAFAQAIPIWRGLTEKLTLASGPGSAYLFSNLGYAYFLNGDYASAVTALEKACLLDPLSYRAWHHLGESLQKLGQEERAQQMFRQAQALQQHDLREDTRVSGGTTVAAIDDAVKTRERGPEWPAADVLQAQNGMLELRRVATAAAVPPVEPAAAPQKPEPAPAAQPAVAPLPALAAPAQSALLEIRNGNGVNGMARTLSRQMGDPDLKVVRLTNEKGFGVKQTRVEYQFGFRAAAERLAQRFENASVVEVSNCKKTDMRLVLGRDLATPRFALRPMPAVTNTVAVVEGGALP
ncbi:tetratricopeptide repeat protein [Massilia solisilvae]|uniref:Tetratricopeptide repeat protein n=1 Tax=Massilia solisilvae TaxID=1811225 RepID=A0ABT2BNR9_9BURK|nr:tetratricopeptide repeat protein [Massilia solisilvae]MCS0610036.1 tetratricopeptide repeat protein [Massilia solisilvae]